MTKRSSFVFGLSGLAVRSARACGGERGQARRLLLPDYRFLGARPASPVALLTRLIWHESNFQADAVSPGLARGIAQFMPATAAERRLANPASSIAAARRAEPVVLDDSADDAVFLYTAVAVLERADHGRLPEGAAMWEYIR
jgi:hypothetical protein